MVQRVTGSCVLLAPLIAAILLVAGCGGGGDTPEGPVSQQDLGRTVYADNCAACHGRSGDGGMGPKLADGAVVERYPDVADHRAVVVNGRGAMPAWGDRLSDEEIDAVVRYERDGF